MNESSTPSTNFLRNIIEEDIRQNKFPNRDGDKLRTRFPPEPNGYLHIGHAKSMFLNFGLAESFSGRCNLRFDDTNPAKEDQEYVDAIIENVEWLGFDYANKPYYASDYFSRMYDFAVHLIRQDKAYVDSQSAEQMRANRGSLSEPGTNSPYRTRSIEENLNLFSRMRAGEFADGTHILRAKIDMAAANINMRDPAIYRIRHANHHRTGDTWCIYPMYTFAHPIEDALEGITHSLCTLEFEDQRPFYDWLLGELAASGLILSPPPQQIEFSRLNLSYVVLSKRKLIQLVSEGHVDGWNDPRMPTLSGARRRGYPPAGFKLFAERMGISKSDSMIDYSVFEDAMREVLNDVCERRIAVLDPIKLIIDNYPADATETCQAPNHPLKPEAGMRDLPFSSELWIEAEDFMEVPEKGFRRLYPGNMVRLRYAYVVKCIGCDKDANGKVIAVHCEYLADSKSGTAGADNYKVKGNLHWLSCPDALATEVRLYDRLFAVAHPGSRRPGDAPELARDFLEDLNSHSKSINTAQVESSLRQAKAEDSFQFERHGYFVADRFDWSSSKPVFNRSVSLRDTWQK